MAEIVDMVVTWAATVAMLYALLNWDERRMSEERLARAWPPATKALAVVVIGIFCLPIHFARTRAVSASFVRRARQRAFGFFLGVAWMIALAALASLVSLGVETIEAALHLADLAE